MLDRVTRLMSWKPLEPGAKAPPLSLTADEGTWIKLRDFETHLHVVLVFFRSGDTAETDAFLKQIQGSLSRFQELETAVFAVSTARTDRLRAYRNKLGLEFFLLYDPFAWESRGFRTSGRVRPFCKDSVVVVGIVEVAVRDQAAAVGIVAALVLVLVVLMLMQAGIQFR